MLNNVNGAFGHIRAVWTDCTMPSYGGKNSWKLKDMLWAHCF